MLFLSNLAQKRASLYWERVYRLTVKPMARLRLYVVSEYVYLFLYGDQDILSLHADGIRRDRLGRRQ